MTASFSAIGVLFPVLLRFCSACCHQGAQDETQIILLRMVVWLAKCGRKKTLLARDTGNHRSNPTMADQKWHHFITSNHRHWGWMWWQHSIAGTEISRRSSYPDIQKEQDGQFVLPGVRWYFHTGRRSVQGRKSASFEDLVTPTWTLIYQWRSDSEGFILNGVLFYWMSRFRPLHWMGKIYQEIAGDWK